MSVAQNFPYSQYIEEIWNRHNPEAAEHYYAENITLHSAAPGFPTGIGLNHHKELLRGFFVTFPDLHLTIEDVITQDDKLVARLVLEGTQQGEFQEIAPTGKRVRVMDFTMYRIVAGKITDVWSLTDMLTLRQQLGAP